jgi:hypothetical protein
MEEHGLTVGLRKDSNDKWVKDFYRVVFDFERRTDWVQALPEIKQRLEKSEREVLMDFHLGLMEGQKGKDTVPKRILGKWSFVSSSIGRTDGRHTMAASSKRSISLSIPLTNIISIVTSRGPV